MTTTPVSPTTSRQQAGDVLPDLGRSFAAVLADVAGMDVTANDHFFDDLCVDSMVMARFCARVRKDPALPSVSMKDVYAHPTARGLATALAPPMAPPRSTVNGRPAPARPIGAVERTVQLAAPQRPGSSAAYVFCAVLQLLIFLGYISGISVVAAIGYDWIAGGSDLLSFYLRTVAVGAIWFTAASVLPIIAKWVLIGRWTEREIRLWSLGYVRFWVVKALLRSNPLMLVAVGSPLYPLYLRLLGAKIGPRVTILSRVAPVGTDLLTIGADTVIRKDVMLSGYRARAGRIEIGPVRIGRDAFVGEASVLDIHTTMNDGAQLAHASSLHAGQFLAKGQSSYGVPARPAPTTFAMTTSVRCGAWRRFTFCFGQLAMLLAVYLPIVLGGADALVVAFPQLRATAAALVAPVGFAGMVVEALLISAGLFFGTLLAGLVLVAVIPRLLAPLVRPDQEYPLYGIRYSAYRTIARLTNLKFYLYLFGDSSYIIGYLRWIGYRMHRVAQTGSNFGTGVKHESPFLTEVGSGTMVADGLSVGNAEFSHSSFRLSRIKLGAHSFLGNRIVYPVGGRTGENVLLATKVLVPTDGKIRENVGLLGSPPFSIPRSVDRDAGFDHVTDGIELHRQLRLKNRYNRRSMALALVVRWLHLFGVIVISLLVAAEYARFQGLSLAVGMVANIVFTTLFFVLVERVATGFRRLLPRFCSIYDPYFWWHERFWKLVIPEWDKTLGGTPYKNLVSRMLGVRMGKRVFDDGCFLPERTLVTIGDDAVLNAGTVVQCHSQEDGTFKSDYSRIGARVTLGVGAFVHYGVSVGDGAELAPDTFLMKGEEVPPAQVWEGNPAHEASRSAVPRPRPRPRPVMEKQ